MSSTFNHFFIPVFLLLVFSDRFGIEKRKILLLSGFAVLPDIDIFLFHRALLHNIFVVSIPISFYIVSKLFPGSSPAWCKSIAIASFYLASHILLDIFNGGVFIFYPIYKQVFVANIDLRFQNSIFVPHIYIDFRDSILNFGRGEPVISSENLGTAILLSILAILSITARKKTSP